MNIAEGWNLEDWGKTLINGREHWVTRHTGDGVSFLTALPVDWKDMTDSMMRSFLDESIHQVVAIVKKGS